jgi:hypothetical protein
MYAVGLPLRRGITIDDLRFVEDKTDLSLSLLAVDPPPEGFLHYFTRGVAAGFRHGLDALP